MLFRSDDIIVTAYSELDFDYIVDANFYEKDGKIVAIEISDSSRTTEVTEHMTVATAANVKVAGKQIYKLGLVIDGAKTTLFTKEASSSSVQPAVYAKDVAASDFLIVEINDNSGEVDKVTPAPSNRIVAANTISEIKTSTKSLKIGSTTVKLGDDAVIVDKTDSHKVIALTSLKDGDTVKALKVSSGSSYVTVLVRTAKAGSTTTPVVEGKLIDTIASPVFVYDGVAYKVVSTTILADKDEIGRASCRERV